MTSPSVTVWLDPGKTTGIAAWYHDRQIFTSVEADFKGTGEWLELMSIPHESAGAVHLGWEQYVVTPGNTRHGTAYWSLEVIGMARWIATRYGLTILQPQFSSMMKMSTDDRLKMISWYKPGKPHANDAARHLLRHCVKAGTLPIELWQKVFAEEMLRDG